MVLQELVKHYDRLRDADTQELPPFGFSRERVHFVLRIAGDGRPVTTIPLGGEDAQGRRNGMFRNTRIERAASVHSFCGTRQPMRLE
jgi:hypothetical protein